MYFWTADEHYFHDNILKFTDRYKLFNNIIDMNNCLIDNHNSVVRAGDIVIHAGDFAFAPKPIVMEIFRKLNGQHIIIKGSHDHWLGESPNQKGNLQSVGRIYEKLFDKKYYIVTCHYAMRTWAKSHFNSWNLYAHSHGRLQPIGKQYDVGVDNNNLFPISLDQIIEIMEKSPDNFNYISSEKRRSK